MAMATVYHLLCPEGISAPISNDIYQGIDGIAARAIHHSISDVRWNETKVTFASHGHRSPSVQTWKLITSLYLNRLGDTVDQAHSSAYTQRPRNAYGRERANQISDRVVHGDDAAHI